MMKYYFLMSVRFEVVHIIVRNSSYITVKLQITQFKLFFLGTLLSRSSHL